MKLESKIQSECVKWFNHNFCLKFHSPRAMMFSIPNELAGNNAVGTMIAKSMGLKKGVSDTIVILPRFDKEHGEVIFVEFKTPNNGQSAEQKDFQKEVETLGFSYVIIRSFDEFKELINAKICKK